MNGRVKGGHLESGLVRGSDDIIVQKSGQKVIELFTSDVGSEGGLGGFKLGAGILVTEALADLFGFFIKDL